MSNPKKDLAYFLSLPYPCEVIASEQGGFVAHHPDLVGCADQGEDLAEALENLSKARKLWLRAKLKDGDPIPEPPIAEPSGRLMLRVPIRLHARLDRLAKMYGKSLTRLLNELLFNYVNALSADHSLENPALAELEARKATYGYRLTPLPDGSFVAEHPDLPGCLSEGPDALQAMANLNEARELWIQGRKEEGLPVPEPLSADHTGFIHLRIPSALHADLVRDAQRNGCTLNQWIVCGLAETTVELNNRTAAAGLREVLRKELRQLSIDVEVAFTAKLRQEYAHFLLGLLYLKKQAYQEASKLFLRATQGNFIQEELEDILYPLREAFCDPELGKAALPISHLLPSGTEAAEHRRALALGILQKLARANLGGPPS
ncbi:MAG TPA: toxin-antitoxin system HicB family antitoxin [Thermoanaerobaculia bacterium]|jgi:predicted RNase H-like HicB family nuclease|nr:toxin-antitoxin system HicB family antitoxin [Thermoanaerobaculia bacterium]